MAILNSNLNNLSKSILEFLISVHFMVPDIDLSNKIVELLLNKYGRNCEIIWMVNLNLLNKIKNMWSNYKFNKM